MSQSMSMLDLCSITTGKLDSNASVAGGEFPFFTCAPETFRINSFAFDTEAVLLGGNNASGIFPVKYYFGKFNAYQRTYVIKTKKPNLLITRFLFFALQLQIARLQNLSTGAATKFLTMGILKHIQIPTPRLSQQVKIVECLSAYEDLIETNRRRIALLEESACLLYREWFVNLRFPGYQQSKMVDGLPVGWLKVPLDNLAFIVMGQSPESKFYNHDGDGLPFHQGVTGFGDHFVSHNTYTTQATRIAEAGDILCSVRAPVGRLNLTLDKIAIGRGLSAIRSRTGQQSLLLYQLKALFVEEDMIGGGAIFASVTKKELFAQQLLQPDLETAAEFNRLARAIDEQIKILVMQNRLLFEARDKLLPKLMSGEIQI